MCSECYGIYPNCPICGEPPRYITCPDCLGAGQLYFTERGDAITKEAYNKLELDDRMIEACEWCGGEGTVVETKQGADPDQWGERYREESA